MALRRDEIQPWIERFNEIETALRRDYYAYLERRGELDETFEEHLERYGCLIRTGEPATAEQIRELERRAGIDLPADLVELYSTMGEINLRKDFLRGTLIHSVAELLRRLALVSGRERIRSLGLVDMMLASWGNDRFELDPERGLLSPAEIDELNAAFTCIGWFGAYHGEGFGYLYLDRDGGCGTLGWHQDEWDEVHARLMAMRQASPAEHDLTDELAKLLRGAVRTWEALAAES